MNLPDDAFERVLTLDERNPEPHVEINWYHEVIDAAQAKLDLRMLLNGT